MVRANTSDSANETAGQEFMIRCRGLPARAHRRRATHPPSLWPSTPNGVVGDPGKCLQRRDGSGGVIRQVIDRRRGPCAGGLAGAALVVGEYRYAGTGQVRPQRVEEPVIVPVRRPRAADQDHARTGTSRARAGDGPAQVHPGTGERDLLSVHLASLSLRPTAC